MDTSDPSIKFSEDGVCDNCQQYESITKKFWKNKQSNKENFKQNSRKI